MFVVAGIGALLASIIIGFTMEGGKIPALIQIAEFVIIGGAGVSSLLAATSPKRVSGIIKEVMGLLKPDPFSRAAYIELLQVLYEISDVARRQGLLALEQHVERPEESAVIQKFPGFSKNHHAVSFLCDSLRLVLMGGVGVFELQEMMDGDIEAYSEESRKNPGLVAKVGDAMPGFGIVAAVLGVVNTMAAIDGPPAVIGEKVGAALVGTFLGILLSYGMIGPMAQAMEARAESGARYLICLKSGLVAFAQGMSPVLVAEFARRTIDSEVRPAFKDVEDVIRGRGAASSDADRKAA